MRRKYPQTCSQKTQLICTKFEQSLPYKCVENTEMFLPAFPPSPLVKLTEEESRNSTALISNYVS